MLAKEKLAKFMTVAVLALFFDAGAAQLRINQGELTGSRFGTTTCSVPRTGSLTGRFDSYTLTVPSGLEATITVTVFDWSRTGLILNFGLLLEVGKSGSWRHHTLSAKNGNSISLTTDESVEVRLTALAVPVWTGYSTARGDLINYTGGCSFSYEVGVDFAAKPVRPPPVVMSATVTFDANGGECFEYDFFSESGDSRINWGESCSFKPYVGSQLLEKAPECDKAGYEFLGWYTARSGGRKISSSETVTGDITIYAHWDPLPTTCFLSLDKQGGSGGTTTVTATYGHALPSITLPMRTGYTFDGYYTEKNGGGTEYYTASGDGARPWNIDLSGAMILYAKWTRNDYTLTFDAAGGTVPGSGSTRQETVTLGLRNGNATTPPIRTNYAFKGYYTARSGGIQVYASNGACVTGSAYWDEDNRWDYPGDLTVYAQWTYNPATCLVTLDSQGGRSGTASVTATYDSAMPSIVIPTRAGYAFGGYYTGANGSGTLYYTATGASARNWDKTSATTLYALWTAATYSVTFDQQGGSGGTASSQVTYGNAMPTIVVPTRAGYTFCGYYTGMDGSGLQYYAASGLSTRSCDQTAAMTLYAFWTANGPVFKISNDVLTAVELNGYQHVEIPDGVTRIEDYAFEDCEDMMSVTIPDSVTSIGAWAFAWCWNLTSVTIPDSVTSIEEGAFGYCTDLTEVKIGSHVTQIGALAFVGCLFLDTIVVAEDNLAYKAMPNLLLSKDGKTLVAAFGDLIDATIPDGVTNIAESAFEDFSDLASVTIPASVVYIGDNAFFGCGELLDVVFEGNAPCVGENAFEAVGIDCMARVPRWNATYDVVDGQWQGMTVAYYEPIFTLVLHKNDGTGTERIFVGQRGEDCYLPGAATMLKWAPRRGFKFMGWAMSEKSKTVYLKDKANVKNLLVAEERLDIYAVWQVDTQNAYAIQYIRNDGSGSVRTIGFVGGVATNLNSVAALGFARRGYDFGGWATTTTNARNKVVWRPDMGIVSQPVANGKLLQIYAIWTLKAGYYSIRFNKNDGTGKWRELGYAYGTKTRLPTCVNGLGWTREGYVFAGWALGAANAAAGVKWKDDWAYVSTPTTAGKTISIYALWRPVAKSLAATADSAACDVGQPVRVSAPTAESPVARGASTYAVVDDAGVCGTLAVEAGGCGTLTFVDGLTYDAEPLGNGVWWCAELSLGIRLDATARTASLFE